MSPDVGAGIGMILASVGALIIGRVQLQRDDRADALDQAEKAEEFGPNADECTWCEGTGLVRRLHLGVEVYVTCGACRGHGAIHDDGRHLLDNDDELYDWARDSEGAWDGGDAA